MLTPEDVVELLAIDLIGIVPEDESIISASNRGSPVALDGKNRAGQAFRNIAQRLLGESVPFLDLESSDGFLGRLSRMIGLGGN